MKDHLIENPFFELMDLNDPCFGKFTLYCFVTQEDTMFKYYELLKDDFRFPSYHLRNLSTEEF